MSEEIPKDEPSRNGDGDDKRDEVLAAAVVDDENYDEDGSDGSIVVVANVVEEEASAEAVVTIEAVASEAGKAVATLSVHDEGAKSFPAKREEEEEDGEIVEQEEVDMKTFNREVNQESMKLGFEAGNPSGNKVISDVIKEEGKAFAAENEAMEPPTSLNEKNSEETSKPSTDGPMELVTSPPCIKDSHQKREESEVEEGEIEDVVPERALVAPSGDSEGTVKFHEESNEGNAAASTTQQDDEKESKSLEEKEELKDTDVTHGTAMDDKETLADEIKDRTASLNDNALDPVRTDAIFESAQDATQLDVSTTSVELDDLKDKVSESSTGMKIEEGEEDGEIKEDAEEGESKDVAEAETESKEDTEEEGEIKEDAEMEVEDALSESGDRDAEMTAPDDAASVDGDTTSIADEPTTKTEPSYGTRGRASGSDTPVPRESATPKSSSLTAASAALAGSNEQWQRTVREALEDLGRGGSKESIPAGVGLGGASFLEALGEEERRTRTRFLPAVEGIHMLRKNEIKSDLALARSIMLNAGNVASVASVAAGSSSSSAPKKVKSKKRQNSSSGEADAMETEIGDMSSSEDDPTLDGGCVGSASTIEVDAGDLLVVPSSAFVPPPAATLSANVPTASNGQEKEDGGTPPAPASSTGVKGILNNQRNIKSPRVVESVTAFNPPRPPESVGKKKQHRMLRWERRPADVELDLNSYRKTVDRTRKELHAEEAELEIIEATSNHLRRHFLGHLQYMDQELDQINSELNSVQQKCVTAADLLTSRTRSRGAGKGSYVMKDVLAVLKARGAELDEKGLSLGDDILDSSKIPKNYPGIGGVGASSFVDWNKKSDFPPSQIAAAWVLPGDKVETPCGEGVVVSISNSTISVRFPYGVGHFNPGAVTSKEYPNTLTDALLAKRWRSIIESALSHSGRLDLNGMSAVDTFKLKGTGQHDQLSFVAAAVGTNANGGSIDNGIADKEANDSVRLETDASYDDVKLLPFGSGLLPTESGRGNKLFDADFLQLQLDTKAVLTDGVGVLGTPGNEGVPQEVRAFEESSQESLILQAKVMQLRNELYRQRRIRTLNERTFQATRDRSTRVESLVAEMRTDLKSLKYRLDEELKELGIDQERAESILKSYYLSHDYGDQEHDETDNHEMSPTSKRSRDDTGEHIKSDGHSPEVQHTAGNGFADGEVGKQAKKVKLTSQ